MRDFEIQIFPSPIEKPTMFHLAGQSDGEAGGWLLDDLHKNLEHCIREKEDKIKNYKLKYKEWWLVLEDRISYVPDEFDAQLFEEYDKINSVFDKIILFDPRDPARVCHYK